MPHFLSRILPAALALFFAFAALGDELSNLLENSKLEQLDGALPAGWSASAPEAKFTAEREFRLDASGGAALPQTFRYTGGAPSLKDVPAGASLCFSVHATAHSNSDTEFAVEAAFLKDGKEIARAATGPQSIYVGWDTVALYFAKPSAAFDQLVVEVKLLKPGRLTFVSPALTQQEKPQETLEWKIDADTYARVVGFPVRHTYFVGREPKSLRLECFLPQTSLKLTLREIGGDVLKEETWTELPVRRRFERDFALPPLGEGAYELVMESGRITDGELFRIRGPQTKGATFDENRWLILDGKPFFPIALNHIPMDDPDFFRVCRLSGINTVGFYYLFAENDFIFEKIRKEMQENELASFHWNTFAYDQRPAADIVRDFGDYAAKVESLPKFIGFLDDETAAHSQADCKGAFEDSALFFKAFPDYILWENHCPRVHHDETRTPTRYFPILRRYSSGMDVLGIDIYPVPAGRCGGNDLPNRSLSCVGDYTEIVDALGWNRKPVWMILQNWAWGEHSTINDLKTYPRPTYGELRFMAYDVILHGATGIDWHSEGGKGHGPCNETDSEYWRDFAFVNLELAQVGAKLAGSVPQGTPQTDGCIRSGRWQNGGETVVIAANESPSEAGVFVTPSDAMLYMSPDARQVPAGQKVELKPYDVVILTTTPIAVAKPERFVRPEGLADEWLWKRGNFTVAAEWVMTDARTTGSEFLRIPCNLKEKPTVARLQLCGADGLRLTINGKPVVKGGYFFTCFELDVAPFLQEGENSIVVEFPWRAARDKGCALCLTDGDGNLLAKTDRQTEWSPNGKDGWQPATSCGPHGPDNAHKLGRGASYLIRP